MFPTKSSDKIITPEIPPEIDLNQKYLSHLNQQKNELRNFHLCCME